MANAPGLTAIPSAWLVATGDCARDGGGFAASYAVVGGVEKVQPVNLLIPGRPLEPVALLKGLLALLEQNA